MMLAHYHGNIIQYSELTRSLGVSDMTIRRYLDILNGTYVIRLLQPWHENLKKRQVKSSKLYFRDSGIHAVLLGAEEIETHPKLGAVGGLSACLFKTSSTPHPPFLPPPPLPGKGRCIS